MKNRIITIVSIGMFLAGALMLMYPTIADLWNGRIQEGMIREYEEYAADMEDYSAEWDRVRDYNRAILEGQQESGLALNLSIAEDHPASNAATASNIATVNNSYPGILNIGGAGVMGVIEVPSVGIRLAVRHGTDENVLSSGAGHIEGTSLPFYENGTHTAISGHSALPSARLFTDLSKLKIGDEFSLTVLDKKIEYTIDKISVVLPEETDLLKADTDANYCTLVTCTPYGINTHRLLVRGKLKEIYEKIY